MTVSMVSAPLFAADGTWNNPNGGNWNLTETENWQGGVIANGSDATANFNAIDVDSTIFNTTINLTEPITIGNLNFADVDVDPTIPTPGGYVFTGSTLTLATSSGSPTINVTNTSATFNNALAGTSGFTKTGNGRLILNVSNSTTLSGPINLNGGEVVLGPNSGTTAVTGQLGSTAGVITFNGGTLTQQFHDFANTTPTGGVIANNLVVPAGQTGTLNLTQRGAVTGTLTGSGTFNVNVNYVRGDISGNWSAFAGQINVRNTGTGTDDFRLTNGNGFANAKLDLGAGVFMAQTFNPPSGSGTQTVQNIGELSGAAGSFIGGNPVNGRFVNWTIGGLNTNSTFAGAIGNSTGASRLTKVGTGKLTLTGANTYTGSTAINAGTLAIAGDGSINNTPTITIANGATLDVSGTNATYSTAANQTITTAGTGAIVGNFLHDEGTLVPGGIGTAATLNFANNFDISGGTLAFDLSPTVAAGGTNDLFNVAGTSNLSNSSAVNISLIGGFTPGTYTLLQAAGGITGDFSGWTVAFATRGAAPALSLSPDSKSLLVTIADAGASAGNLTWQGAVNGVWDVATTSNWFNTATNVQDKFFQGDNVRFSDTFDGTNAPANTTITIAGAVRPGAMVFDGSSTAYTIGGTGSIAGTGSLTKTGTASLTLTTNNSYSGGTTVTGASTVTVNAGSFGTGPITLAGGPTIVLNGGHVVGNALTVTDAATIRSGAATSGVAALSGAGTLTAELAGANFDLTGSHADFTGSLVFRKTTAAAITSIRLFGTAGGANTTYDIGDGVEMYKRNGAGTITLGALQGTAAASLRSSGNGSTTFIIGTKTGVDSNFAGVISDTGETPQAGFTTSLTKAGDTTLTLTGANTYTGPTVVQAGTLLLGAAAHAPVLTNAGGADLQGGKLVLSYAGGTNPASQVQSILDAGFDLTPKFSTGQIRSTTLPEGRLIGWIDRPANEAVTIAVTLPGDTDVNLAVNFDDLLALAQNYDANGTGKVWSQGDSNYDGTVNFDDLLALAQNYGSSALAGDQVALVGESFAADFAMAQSLVPEPATLGLLAGGLTLIGRRRRA